MPKAMTCIRLDLLDEFVYSSRMNTFQILNDTTKEVVDTAPSYIEAVGIADHLTFTTGTLHFVPTQQHVLEFA